MQIQLSSLFIVLLLAACSSDSENRHQANEQAGIKKHHLNFQISGFVQSDSSRYILIPLSMGETSEGSFVESRSYKEFNYDYWNIVFYNPSTREFHLLDDSRKMVIHSYDTKNQANDKVTLFNNAILYSVTTLDYNHDKKLNGDDPTYLFMSDKDGKNFRQISPDTCQLNSFQMIRNSTHLIMSVTRDSNRNLHFDTDDERIAFEIDLASGNTPAEIFSEEFKNKVKDLFDKNWKRNEQEHSE